MTQLSAKHKQEQEEAVASATEKLRSELQTPGSDAAQVAVKHAEELKSLEARLIAKHEAEMKAVIEKIRNELTQANTTQGEKQSLSAEEHEQALKAATERGRMEYATKLKLKDSMLQKAQNNAKHLETQIKAWREAGLVPMESPVAASGSGTVLAVAASQSAAASTSTGGSTAAAAPNALPRKPSAVAAIAGAARGAPNTRGRGLTRGAARGGAPGRGGAPAQAAAPAAAQAVSIMGAAGKRNREEGEAASSDSLAKRLKPAEGVAKPVAFRRDRIAPQPPPAPPAT